jgi:hypothetical protein
MSTLEQWTTAVCAELGLDPGTADTRAVLDLAREVAHSVDRPAAPLTAYLAGIAVGRGMDPETAATRVLNRAQAWAAETAAENKKPAQGQERT